MKKAAVLVILILFSLLSACSTETGNNLQESWYNDMQDEVVFKVVTSAEYFDLNDTIGAYENFEVDEKLALLVGDAVLAYVFGEERLQKTRVIVAEITSEDCFVVTRMTSDRMVAGGDINIAIRKNGEILKIWMGE